MIWPEPEQVFISPRMPVTNQTMTRPMMGIGARASRQLFSIMARKMKVIFQSIPQSHLQTSSNPGSFQILCTKQGSGCFSQQGSLCQLCCNFLSYTIIQYQLLGFSGPSPVKKKSSHPAFPFPPHISHQPNATQFFSKFFMPKEKLNITRILTSAALEKGMPLT